ncbi:MAG TPA: antibiotic biosynthesis monooxygenase [Bryobacteraceae bacterium]|nr:antibiotic biosynthesis monooxygenase [Bryobacteraceae bacterium]
MIVVVFRSRLTPEAGSDYGNMAAEMAETAKDMPGFIDVKSFTAEDGERLTLVWWKDRETLMGWRNHPRHQIAQETGRAKWYQYYKIEVAEVIRDGAFTRPLA